MVYIWGNMPVFIDNRLLKLLLEGSVFSENLGQIEMERSSFLTCIGLGKILESFPAFDEKNTFFAFCSSDLTFDLEKEVVTYLYDQIFVQCLTDVQNSLKIEASFLLEQIEEKEKTVPDCLSSALLRYKERLMDSPKELIHDLTLYLAWDLVCLRIAILFENISSDPRNQNLLQGLQECLLESFTHITQQGKTKPDFFRMCEALYANAMREENLQEYPQEEWEILSKSCQALMPRKELSDVFYLSLEDIGGKVFTLDSPHKVQAVLHLAKYMMQKIKQEIPSWQHVISPLEVVYGNP